MGSITVYRSTLVGSNEVSNKLKSYLNRLLRRTSNEDHTPDAPGSEDALKVHKGLPAIPRPTLTGLRTMFGAKSHTVSTMDSEYELMELDYHAYTRVQAAHDLSHKSKGDVKST